MFRPPPPVARLLAPLLAAVLLGSCGGDPTDTGHGPPAAVQVVAGNAQQDTVGEELAEPVVVRVVDAEGRPVPGQAVSFRVTAGGGSVLAGAAVTDAAGEARDRWTLGTSTAAAQALEARAIDNATGAALATATISATPLADAPSVITRVSGHGQNALVQTALADSLLVRLLDRHGNPVPGVPVTFTMPAGAGTLSQATDVTSATGHARTKWTLGAAAGSFSVTAAAGALSTTFDAVAVAAGEARLEIVSGSGQTGPVGSTLPGAVVVRALSGTGAPVAGVPVTFAIAQNNGFLPGDLGNRVTVNTGPDGTATTRWGLGGTAGDNALRASAPGYASVTFTATGTAGPAARVTKVAGDRQNAAPGAAVAVAPAVLVTDVQNNPVSGVTVTFAVTSGGGSVTGATATTDAVGIARPGSWTLGPQEGENALSATVTGIAPVVFTANAGTSTTSDISVSIVSPTSSSRVYGSVLVRAIVTSTYQLASVRARVGSTTVDMSYVASSGEWRAQLPLPAMSYGPFPIRVIATDVLGGVTEAIANPTYDAPPGVTVHSPVPGAVARPNLAYHITCGDDNPGGAGCPLRLRYWRNGASTEVASSQNGVLQGTVSLAQFAGETIEFWIEVLTPELFNFPIVRMVHVEPSAQLREVVAGEGILWDASGDRALYAAERVTSNSGTRAFAMDLRLRRAGSGATEVLWSGELDNREILFWGGRLTPAGAIFNVRRIDGSAISDTIYEWRNGQRIHLGPGNSNNSGVFVAGNYAAWAVGGTGGIIRRDLAAGTNAGFGSTSQRISLAADGTVAYLNEFDVYLDRPGVGSVRVAPGSSGSLGPRYRGLVAVPAGVLYLRRSRPTVSDPFKEDIVLNKNGTEVVLATYPDAQAVPGEDYAASDDGWIAFTKPDIAGVPHVWRRSPDGAEQQVSLLAAASRIDAIGPGGQIVFRVSNRRYLAPAGSTTARDVGSSLGTAVWRDGRFLVLLGNTALEILP